MGADGLVRRSGLRRQRGGGCRCIRRYFALARTIGLEDVVVRLGDEARPAAAAALEPVTGRRESAQNKDYRYQNEDDLSQHVTSIDGTADDHSSSIDSKRSVAGRFFSGGPNA